MDKVKPTIKINSQSARQKCRWRRHQSRLAVRWGRVRIWPKYGRYTRILTVLEYEYHTVFRLLLQSDACYIGAVYSDHWQQWSHLAYHFEVVVGCITLTAEVIILRSVKHLFPGFLTLVLTQLFFPKPPTTFLTCFCRGERRKYTYRIRLKRGSNSQPQGHESDTLTTDPPGRGLPLRGQCGTFPVTRNRLRKRSIVFRVQPKCRDTTTVSNIPAFSIPRAWFRSSFSLGIFFD